MDESTDALAKFSARCDSVKLLFAMVSSIHNMKKDQYAVLRLHAKGLRISIESTAKCMHATAYMNREHFSAFELPPVRGEGTEIQCKIHMTTLLECLSIFGTNALASTALYLAYSEEEGYAAARAQHALALVAYARWCDGHSWCTLWGCARICHRGVQHFAFAVGACGHHV
ncbi:hypothetical protein EON66_07810 [archaeon]|nr:MAG: hypothetical protein EON66_07810 [archaeon]